jgi:hypothetical protein
MPRLGKNRIRGIFTDFYRFLIVSKILVTSVNRTAGSPVLAATAINPTKNQPSVLSAQSKRMTKTARSILPLF